MSLVIQQKTKLQAWKWGREGEDRALAWYLENGARLLVRNFRRKCGEIDLILEEVNSSGRIELVFVEVRSRAQKSWQSGIESVGPKKRFHLEQTGALFLAQYRGNAFSVRWDIWAWDGKNWIHCPRAW